MFPRNHNFHRLSFIPQKMVAVNDPERVAPRRRAPSQKLKTFALCILSGVIGVLLGCAMLMCMQTVSANNSHHDKRAVQVTASDAILPSSEPVVATQLRARSVDVSGGDDGEGDKMGCKPGDGSRFPSNHIPSFPDAAEFSSKCKGCPNCPEVQQPQMPERPEEPRPDGPRPAESRPDEPRPEEFEKKPSSWTGEGVPDWAEHGEDYYKPVSEGGAAQNPHAIPDMDGMKFGEDPFESDPFFNPGKYHHPNGEKKTNEQLAREREAERRVEMEAERKAEAEAEAKTMKQPQGEGEDAPDTYTPEFGSEMPWDDDNEFTPEDAGFSSEDWAECENRPRWPGTHWEPLGKTPEGKTHCVPYPDERPREPIPSCEGDYDKIKKEMPDFDFNMDDFEVPDFDKSQYGGRDSGKDYTPPPPPRQMDSYPEFEHGDRNGENFNELPPPRQTIHGSSCPQCQSSWDKGETCYCFPSREDNLPWSDFKKRSIPPNPARAPIGPPLVHPAKASALIAQLLDICKTKDENGTPSDGCRALKQAIQNGCGSNHPMGLTPHARRLREITETGTLAIPHCGAERAEVHLGYAVHVSSS